MPTTPSPFKPEDYKDKCGNWRSPQGITVPVRVLDARRAYGRIELQVTPLNGEGEAWVQAAYVTLDKYKKLTPAELDKAQAFPKP